jgi:hypothetical protein
VSYRIKQIIADKFWIVESDHGQIGTIKRLDDRYQFFNKLNMTAKIIGSLDDFAETVHEPAVKTTNKTCNGYPTNSTTVIPVRDPNLPTLFKKSDTANTLFAAGYYVIKFKDWLPSFCPKYKTLVDREFLGPFFTEWEMNIELKRAKKAESWQ